MATMSGVVLPGASTVQARRGGCPRARTESGHGQVLLQMKASSSCGSDIRTIYREHLGSPPEDYRGVIAGHEPCGQAVSVGPGYRQVSVGDRVVVYHIAGCGVCEECRHGSMIGSTSPFRDPSACPSRLMTSPAQPTARGQPQCPATAASS
jgi:threonine dehydrogenase-like Zn-dependent dehydrogenase